MRFRDSKKMQNLITVQRSLKRIMESYLIETIRKREEINLLRKELIESTESILFVNPALACHYVNFYRHLSEDEKKITDLQRIQEAKILSGKIKLDRLTRMKDESLLFEEREYDEEKNQDNIEQRILFNTVSHKFKTSY
ncbi:hypothetical protein [Candidatus Liberibacter sp.]|uniref:hypothetical protein n=1 Tax=Candidatus Liberibacter sp. TaxID=34022 RepID=UPI0015F5FD2D|nr:hypothetical protein [Candidatus Liberibacter sp.]MBA5723540.1 hypothetical protein [Candidatus Liberibacter sp.]